MRRWNRKNSLFTAWLLAVTVVPTLTLAVGQAAAADLTCGTTVTTSVTLEHNLLNCPNDGLIVGANDITIDLNGHVIEGPGTDDFRWDGVDNGAGFDNVVVKNGGIRNFGGDGVYLDQGANGNHLRNLRLRDNGIGVEVFASTDNSITGGALLANHNFGAVVVGSTNTLVRGNEIRQNGADGILLREATGSLITRNVFTGNLNTAVQILAGSGNTVVRNELSGSQDHCCAGIFISSVSNLVANNEFSNFGNFGIFIGDSFNRVEGNTLRDSGIGIVLRGNPFFCCQVGNVVAHNISNRNDVGIGVDDMTDTQIAGNVANQNRIGIAVRESSETLIRRNLTTRNGEDGILVEDPRTTITENTANFNGDLGIEAVAGVTDGGGNSATGNGNPAQCVNVACT